MQTHHDEPLLERYQREHREYEEFRMKKHTAGKLTVVDNSWEVSSIYDESRQCIAVCHIYPGATEETQAEHEFRKEADARRLVACWNACEGLSTEQLERCGTLDRADVSRNVAISRTIETLADEKNRLSAINAELLVALKVFQTHLEAIVASDWRKWEELATPEEFERWVKSRANHMAVLTGAAIAKAQGGQ